jgi:flagellin
MTRINTNVSSLVAQKTLGRSNAQLQQALTRLSTGLRINVGKDDPAGLIASEVLRSDITGVQRAITNSERANQLIATADSALGQVSALLNDIRGLISEAANTGALSDEQIAANQLQVDASLESIDRIARLTSFQGRRLLDGSLDFLTTSPGFIQGQSSASVSTNEYSNALVSGNTSNSTFTVTALSAGASGDVTLRFINDGGITAGSETVTTIGGELTVSIDSATTAAQVISAINAQSTEFQATAVGAVTGTFEANYVVGTTASALISGTDASITFTSLSIGTAQNRTIRFVDSASLTAGSETVTLSGTELTITIRSGASTINQIVSAVNAQSSLYSATAAGSGASVYSAGGTGLASAGTNNSAIRSFAASGGGTGGITIRSENAGASFNDVAIRFTSGGTAGSETVSYDVVNKVLNVTIQDGVSNASQIVSAINANSIFSADLASGALSGGIISATAQAAVTSAGYSDLRLQNIQIDQANFGTLSSIAVEVQVDAQATQAQATYSGTALVSDLTLKISGAGGSDVKKFGAGSTLQDIADAINLVSDSTGVSARVASGVSTNDLVFTSTEYGSDAFVEIGALNGAAFDLYDRNGVQTNVRQLGTDVRARINGVAADAEGLKAAINTSTLDLNFTVSERLANGTSISFTITGGGANFQLGPDVVSNQQTRIGIQTISTATLGGSAGTLFEIRSGEAKSLKLNPTEAGAIVEQTITAVTNLRGRLGAFQRTTLETNIFSLNDTLENLTEAESSIRDTDFAAESARLTRAQILVQAGTSVLAIANQNPQNVLSLLR